VLHFLKWLPLGLLISVLTAWGTMAIYYGDSRTTNTQTALAVGFAVLGASTVMLLLLDQLRIQAIAAYFILFFVVLFWWFSIAPSNDRDWQTDVSVLPYATVDGDIITMHNIRNFDYTSEFVFSPAYYDKEFNLNDLTSVDLIAAYWMGPAIAHTIISFGFNENDYLSISIEARKEMGEEYSAVKGFFRQYELFYVVANESDVIKLRTNYRKNPTEDVYLYRIQNDPDLKTNAKKFFMEYVRKINALRRKPEFYNTATTNCTGNIWLHAQVLPDTIPFSWKVQFSGYLPEYLYEQNKFNSKISFAELHKRSYINPLAQNVGPRDDFSKRIRRNLQ